MALRRAGLLGVQIQLFQQIFLCSIQWGVIGHGWGCLPGSVRWWSIAKVPTPCAAVGVFAEEFGAGQGQGCGVTNQDEMVDEVWLKSGMMAQEQGGRARAATKAMQCLIDEAPGRRIQPRNPVVDDQQLRIAGE